MRIPGRRPRDRAQRPALGPGRPNGRIGLGLVLIGTGRAAGFAQFGASPDAFLASLAPLLGFMIVLGGVLIVSDGAVAGLTAVASWLCTLLTPPVIADLFCRWWGRGQHWALYANVLNCAQWLMLAVLVLLIPFGSLAASLGLPLGHASLLVMAAFAVYFLWFQWFAARHALDLSHWRAVVVVLGVVLGTGVLLQVPEILAGKPILPDLGVGRHS